MGRKSPICTEWAGFEVFSGIISARCGAGDAERQTSDPFLTSILTYTVNDVVADTSTCSDHVFSCDVSSIHVCRLILVYRLHSIRRQLDVKMM